MGGKQVAQQRVDAARVAAEDAHPVDAGKPVGQVLGRSEIADVYEGVVLLAVGNAAAIEAARQPLVAVDVDLDRKRKPRLQLDVDQTELAVEEVEVEVQALAPGGPHERVRLLPDQRERPARLEHREHTDQPFLNTVPLGNAPCGPGR